MKQGLHTATDISCEERLELLLSESVQAAKVRARNAFDELTSPFENRLVLFGCGGLGKWTLAGLQDLGLQPLCLSDNNPALWGKEVGGLPILSPQDAGARFGSEAAFVITIWNGSLDDRMSDRLCQLRAVGCRIVVPAGFLFWKYPEKFLPRYALDLPHKVLESAPAVRAAFKQFVDTKSQQEFVAQVAFRLNLEFDTLGKKVPDHYFPKDVYPITSDEVLIDCGAFDGDTIAAFVDLSREQFKHIVAFEPDKLNWGRLQRRLQSFPANVRSRISSRPYAVGATAGKLAFEPTGTDLSVSGIGSDEVECVTLDDSLDGLRPTIIKFDIEGAELSALEGATSTIRRNTPVLAVSAYHQQGHLWEIPLKVVQGSDAYRLFLRPHGTEGWDLVCYAVPQSRC